MSNNFRYIRSFLNLPKLFLPQYSISFLAQKIVTHGLWPITMVCKGFPTPSGYLPKTTRWNAPTQLNQKKKKKSSCAWCCQSYIQLLKRPISDMIRGAGETWWVEKLKVAMDSRNFFPPLILLCSDFLYYNDWYF